jgi:hypothetical protein
VVGLVVAAAALLFSSLVLGIIGGLITARWPSFTPRTRWLLTAAGGVCGVIVLVGGQLTDDQSRQPAAVGEAAPASCTRAFPRGIQDPLSINVVVQDDDKCFKAQIVTMATGATRTLAIRYQNGSRVVQENVVVRISLPPSVLLVPNSTDLINSNTRNRWERYQSNGISVGGIDIGAYMPDASAYVRFNVTVPFESDLECGLTRLRAVGVARPKGLKEFYNTTDVNVVRTC